jgi:hypothetical protein
LRTEFTGETRGKLVRLTATGFGERNIVRFGEALAAIGFRVSMANENDFAFGGEEHAFSLSGVPVFPTEQAEPPPNAAYFLSGLSWGKASALDSVGINRREVVNERVTQERSSEPF